MFTKFAIICSLTVVASAISPGYLSSAYALGNQAEQTYRGYGGLSSVSKQAKAVDSAYSTVRKSDIRITNDAAYAPHPVGPVTYTHHGNAYAAPSLTHGYAAPAAFAHGYHAPGGTITYTRSGYGPTTLAHGYGPATLGYAQGTVAHGYAPGTVAHGYAPGTVGYAPGRFGSTTVTHGYAPGIVSHHGYPSIGYAQKTISGAPTATVSKGVAVQSGGLGVAYSPATSVATSTFSGHGVHYGY